jgi:hypothetical protein
MSVVTPRTQDDWDTLAGFFAEQEGTPTDGWSALFVESEERKAIANAVADLVGETAEAPNDGADYLSVLRHLHEQEKPRRYLEIGVNTGQSLELAAQCELAVGIDPAPALPDRRCSANPFVVHRTTSDAFFAESFSRRENVEFDLSFIDGLHIFEFALRDFIGAEALSSASGTICLHDVRPNNLVEASRFRLSQYWTGDVWRVILVLQKFRPDLSIEILRAPPTGLAVVRNADPGNRTLVQKYKDAVAYGRSVSAVRGASLTSSPAPTGTPPQSALATSSGRSPIGLIRRASLRWTGRSWPG